MVRKVGFTGSTPVGKILAKQAADTVKKVRRCDAHLMQFNAPSSTVSIRSRRWCKWWRGGSAGACANK